MMYILQIVLTRTVITDNPNGRDFVDVYERTLMFKGSKQECLLTRDDFLLSYQEEHEGEKILSMIIAQIDDCYIDMGNLEPENWWALSSIEVKLTNGKKYYFFETKQ